MTLSRFILPALALATGAALGAGVGPVLAEALQVEQVPQSDQDPRSDWTVFVGNTNDFDNTVWIVRYNRVTGETWYKDGKRYVVLEAPR